MNIFTQRNPTFLPGLMFVIAVHGALLYFLFKQQFIPPPKQLETLFVNFIPSARPKEEPKPQPPAPPKSEPVKKPQSRRIVAETPVVSESEPVALSFQPEPEPEAVAVAEPAPAPAPQMPAGPVTLSSELSVACPQLNAPAYPALSRRLGEEGKLVLRVELDEKGHVAQAQIVDSSGFKRLDEAAIAAVKTWRCTPPVRNGQAVRAVALQPFNFVLQGD